MTAPSSRSLQMEITLEMTRMTALQHQAPSHLQPSQVLQRLVLLIPVLRHQQLSNLVLPKVPQHRQHHSPLFLHSLIAPSQRQQRKLGMEEREGTEEKEVTEERGTEERGTEGREMEEVRQPLLPF